MSKKTLNIGNIVNELEGASAFFKPAPQLPQQSEKPSQESPSTQEKPHARSVETTQKAEPVQATNEKSQERTAPPPPVHSYARTGLRVKRTITRYAFEFFQDQLESLKRYSLDEQMRGERGSMSQMVREAVDAYIAKRNNAESMED